MHLQEDESSCPILGLGFILWASRRFVTAVDPAAFPGVLEFPRGTQQLLQEGARPGTSKVVTNWA